jgi:hypothetical protein
VRDFDPAGTSTKVNVHTDKSVDMHTNVQIAQGTTPSSSVITNNSYLYSPHEYHKGRCPYMYVGNCCDFWLCDCQLTTLYGKVAAKLRVSCELSDQHDVSMAPISTRAQYTADPRSQSNGTLQQGTNLEFSGDSRGLMGMGVVHESQMPTFTPSFTDPTLGGHTNQYIPLLKFFP